MILNSPYITGSLTVTGNANVQGTLTVTGSLSGTATSASLALNSNLLQGTGSVGFATTSSFAATSGSVSSRITQIENVYATTGSNSFRANQSITGSLVVSSTITAQTLVVQTVTSSIVYSSGSNIFGSALTDRQTFTGSVSITGSLTIGGGLIMTGSAISVYNNSGTPYISVASGTGSIAYMQAVNNTEVQFGDLSGTNSSISLYTGGARKVFISGSGAVGIGTTSPNFSSVSAGITVLTLATSTTDKYSLLELVGNRGTGGNQNGAISFINNNGTATITSRITGVNTAGSVLGGEITFETKADAGSITERMRITSAGYVGIGTTSPDRALDVTGLSAFRQPNATNSTTLSILQTATGGNGFNDTGLVVQTNAGDGTTKIAHFYDYNSGTAISRMAILRSGKVGIGVTNPNYSLTVAGSIQAGYILLGDTGNGVNNTIEMTTGTNSTTYSAGHIQYYSNGYLSICNGGGNVYIGIASGAYKLTLNGQPGANGYTAWTNYSDSRLKEIITDLEATNILDKICAIRPVTFNYNELSGFDETTRSRRISGFIAQELMEKFPDMIGTIKLDNTEYYDTNLSNLNLYLVKAIQELKAEIDELKNK